MKPPVFSSKEEYYNSPKWRSKRRQKLTEQKYRCERCGKTKHLHVHHLSYLNLYNEPMSDLQVVCRDCHPIADAIREYDSALDTYIDKIYGEDCDFIDMEQVSEEFDEWLRWQENKKQESFQKNARGENLGRKQKRAFNWNGVFYRNCNVGWHFLPSVFFQQILIFKLEHD